MAKVRVTNMRMWEYSREKGNEGGGGEGQHERIICRMKISL